MRPNIILVTIDALRADHLGVYGYPRPTSPSIDAFAREAIVVSDAISHAPYTKASMGSLFSGLWPTTHKAYTTTPTFGEVMQGRAGRSDLPYTDVLSDQIETLPEVLQAAGYETVGFSTNPYLIGDFGFAQGFEHFTFFSGADFAPASEVVRQALTAVDSDDSRPLFLWVHLMEPHSSYDPPEPYRSMFPPREPPRRIDPAIIPPWILTADSDDLNVYLALYDAEIRTADAAFGELLDGLRARGLWDRSVIVLTSDHGEEFMDHGGMEHNRQLYDEMLRVPLLVRLPARDAARVRAQIQLVDLFPTLATLAGARAPESLHGTNVLEVLEGRAAGDGYAYAEVVGARYALRTARWKFISSLQGGRELFDLEADPGETRNLARDEVTRASELEQRLMRMVALAVRDADRIDGQSAPVSPEVYDRLRALGYIRRE